MAMGTQSHFLSFEEISFGRGCEGKPLVPPAAACPWCCWGCFYTQLRKLPEMQRVGIRRGHLFEGSLPLSVNSVFMWLC